MATVAATEMPVVNGVVGEHDAAPPNGVVLNGHHNPDQLAASADHHHDGKGVELRSPPPPPPKPLILVPNHLKKRVRNEYYRIRQMKRHKRSDVVKVNTTYTPLKHHLIQLPNAFNQR